MTARSRFDDLLDRPALGRRQALRRGALVASGLAAAALLGCGGDDDEAAQSTDTSSQPAASGHGTGAQQVKVYKDPTLPYAYTFAEPNKPLKKGGIFKVAVNWDYATQDTTKGAGSGTIAVPNIVYNRLIGHVRDVSPIYNPFKLQLEPQIAKS